MKKKGLIITLSIIFIIASIVIAVLLNIDKRIRDIETYDVVGTIIGSKITLEEQYLIVQDNNGNEIKVIISENTIFKEQLGLEDGDLIKIKGDIENNKIQAKIITK